MFVYNPWDPEILENEQEKSPNPTEERNIYENIINTQLNNFELMSKQIRFNIELLNPYLLKAIPIIFLKFNQTEKILIEVIKSSDKFSKLQKKFLKDLVREYLGIQLKDFKEYENIMRTLDESYELFIKESLEINSLKLIVQSEEMDRDILSCKEILIKILRIKCEEYLVRIKDRFRSEDFPYFLVKLYKKKLKTVISRKIKYIFDFRYINAFIKENEDLKTLETMLREIINVRMKIFDIKFINRETSNILFQCLFMSNSNYLIENKYSNVIFFNNLKKYLYMMNVLQAKDDNNLEIQFYVNYINEVFSYDLVKREKLVKESFEKIVGILKEDKNRFLFILLSFSLMLNNILTLNEVEDKEKKKDLKTEFTFELKCSAREQIFLKNFLIEIEKLSGFISSFNLFLSIKELNYLIECFVFSDILKYYSKESLEHDTKNKIFLDFQQILDKTEAGLVIPNIKTKFEYFIKSINHEEVKEKKGKSLVNLLVIFNIFKRVTKETEKNIIDFPLYINFNDPKLITPHAFILIPGIVTDNYNCETFWSKILSKHDNFVDFYFLEWKNNITSDLVDKLNKKIANFTLKYCINKKHFSNLNRENKDQLSDNEIIYNIKNSCRIYGNLLAFILSSRSIFKFQSVTLIGNNLGCKIIKHCLNKLFEIFQDFPDVFDIIQNIVFISGTITFNKPEKWNKIFELVGGNIINCFSKNDELIKVSESYFNKNNYIGLKPLNSEIYNYNKVINFDFSEEINDYKDYMEKLDMIFDKISII